MGIKVRLQLTLTWKRMPWPQTPGSSIVHLSHHIRDIDGGSSRGKERTAVDGPDLGHKNPSLPSLSLQSFSVLHSIHATSVSAPASRRVHGGSSRRHGRVVYRPSRGKRVVYRPRDPPRLVVVPILIDLHLGTGIVEGGQLVPGFRFTSIGRSCGPRPEKRDSDGPRRPNRRANDIRPVFLFFLCF